ncbi:MAG: FAD-binding oxidoreductase, partial [Acidimicrobiales bacterium]
AGGMHVLRHGAMRQRVAGLEAVLSDGAVLDRMAGLEKESVGWDLASLLVGSEGSLAVITAVAIRCVTAPRHRVTALVALGPAAETTPAAPAGPAAPAPGAPAPAARAPEAHTDSQLGDCVAVGMVLVDELRRRVDGLEAVEIVSREGMELATAALGLPEPPAAGRASGWLTIEAAGEADPSEQLASVLDGAPGVLTVAVAADRASRRRLWRYREGQSEAIATLGIPHKLDISVPPGRLATFAADVGTAVRDVSADARAICFGHLADGNLHVNVVGPAPDDDAVDDALLRLAVSYGGSVSAEHGIGVARLDYVSLVRSTAEMAVMRSVKSALDPAGVLNPGVLIPEPRRP